MEQLCHLAADHQLPHSKATCLVATFEALHGASAACGFRAKCSMASMLCAVRAGLDLQNLELHLEVNGKVRQHGNTNAMLYRIPHLLVSTARDLTSLQSRLTTAVLRTT